MFYNLQLLKHDFKLPYKLCRIQESKKPFYLLPRCKANVDTLSFHLTTCNYAVTIFTYDTNEHC